MGWRGLLWIGVLFAASVGCAKAVPTGGLMVVVGSDGTLPTEPDTLHIEVGPADGGALYRDASYPIADASTGASGTYALPVTFAIDSNGDPNASVRIVVGAGVSKPGGSTALETLSYTVNSIPTDEVAELDVVFRAQCASSASGVGGSREACCPTPGCTWTASGACECSGPLLPQFPDDAGWGPLGMGESGSADATSVDSGDGDAGLPPDAGSCETGAMECSDPATPQRCTSTGQWQDQQACESGFTYCFQGRCVPVPTSCVGTDYSLCGSYEVPGGTFQRGDDPLHEDAGAPATISPFRLDAYEIPLWRFRAFVTAVTLGTGLPDGGAGIHANLAGGEGLNAGGDAGAYETGWDPSWDTMFPTQETQWDSNLDCSYLAGVWTPDNEGNEDRPINCVTWYEAYAFCIWDGGFLPSEAEWNYAAAGGALQRLYPWGSTDPGVNSQYAVYGCLFPQAGPCNGTTTHSIGDVDQLPMGTGLFGQWALAGNVSEWTFDFYDSTYPSPCTDCAALSGTQRVFRGGGFDRPEEFLYTSTRVPADPTGRFQDVGFRCARTP
ncbi:MAG: formylglycine-generating enzyme family protein [Polyangiaceae bacterium]